MWVRSLARLCLAMGVLVGAAFAQISGTGTIVGTITDNSGAIITGAKISV